MSKSKAKSIQLRLLLPEDWISELDNLADSRFLSRLGLLRFYIRSGMDDDLSNLAEHFRVKGQQRQTHKHLAERVKDFER